MEDANEVDDDGEWGFCVQLEQDDGEAEEVKRPHTHSHTHLLPTSPKTMKISVKQTVTRGLSTSDSETSLAAPSFPRIKSNSSFQELERAIGATLAMSFPEPDAQNPVDISTQMKVINHINGVITQKATLKKNLQQQRPIMRHRSTEVEPLKRGVEKDDEYPMRAELLPYLEENESRALVIFHSRDIIAFDIKSACQMFGSLYYFRSDFHSCGLTLLAYFDLRSAIDAKEKLASRLGRLAKATVFSSIMLQPSVSCHECSLRIHRVLNTKSEAYVQKVFSNYGPLRSIQRSFNDSGVKGTLTETLEGDTNCDYTAEYYNIQDAKLAAAEMNSSTQNVLGAEVVFVPLEKRVQRLKSALLSTLASWRIRMAEDETVTSAGTEGNQRDAKPEKLPIPDGSIMGGMGTYKDSEAGGNGSSIMEAVDGSNAPPPPPNKSSTPPPSSSEPLVSTKQTMKPPQQVFETQNPNSRGYGLSYDGGQHQAMGGFHPQQSGHQMYPYPTSHDYGSQGYPHPGMHVVAINGYMPYGGAPGHHLHHPHMYGGVNMSMQHMHAQPQVLHGNFDHGGYATPGMEAHHNPHGLQLHQQRHSHHSRQSKRNNNNQAWQTRPPHHNGGHAKRNGQHQSNTKSKHASESVNLPLSPHEFMNNIENRTTVMIRNIPNKYTQSMLLEEINQNFDGLYDFFYLPIDFHNKCNVGYAFINFVETRDVVRFFEEFNDQRWRNFNSEKVCALSYARIQGKAAMISRFQKSTLLQKDDSYKPLLFVSKGERKGQPEPFLPPSSSGA